MRAMCAAVLAATMMVSSVAQADAPLAAGKPAGIKQAQIETGGVLLVVGILVVAGAIAAIASQTQGKSTVAPTTTNP